MRLYSFTNYYLSSLQHGLQTAHVVGELFRKYSDEKLLQRWINDEKTIIIKNGGNHMDLVDIKGFFDTTENPYPWAYFEEDYTSLNNTVTAVGIVVPEKFYTRAPAFDHTDWELQLHDLIQRTPLAV